MVITAAPHQQQHFIQVVIKDNNHLFELIECLRGSVLVPRPRGRPLQYVLQKEKQIQSRIRLEESHQRVNNTLVTRPWKDEPRQQIALLVPKSPHLQLSRKWISSGNMK